MARVPGFVKWVLGPLLAGVLGYTVVAPRLGGKIPLAKLGIPALGGTKTIPAPEAPTENSNPQRESLGGSETPKDAETASAPPPSVSIGVKPVIEATAEPSREEEAPKPRKRRRRRRPRVSESPRRERTPERPPELAPSEPAPPTPTGPDPASTPDG